MLRCDNCGALFEAPVAPSRDSSDGLPYCPRCGTPAEYDEVEGCDYCGDYSTSMYTLYSGDHICERCYKATQSEINELFSEWVKDTAAEYGLDIDDVKDMIFD